jgi:phosphoribosylformylglycinamidine (FGAM) synthase-like enzyme
VTDLILTQHTVLIIRDPMVKIPVTIFAHELPVCQLVNGEENVEIIETSQVEVTNFDLEAEYDRLMRKYAMSQTTAVVDIYGNNPRLLAEELGLPWQATRGARTVKKLDQSLVVDNTIDAPAALPNPNAVIGRKVKKAA